MKIFVNNLPERHTSSPTYVRGPTERPVMRSARGTRRCCVMMFDVVKSVVGRFDVSERRTPTHRRRDENLKKIKIIINMDIYMDMEMME